ncbi:hypothetical protein GOP47_0017229 [Adiantum capillus-veneris]|uniref:Uncharacterized protein n=1 Tax=Adiantum capillus-veneris TaxID=13818 RepID=A0A9D4UJ76_ADICA|nr:hypothetical protein GOP47_0017229 [Adiantum capillus-veneris]
MKSNKQKRPEFGTTESQKRIKALFKLFTDEVIERTYINNNGGFDCTSMTPAQKHCKLDANIALRLGQLDDTRARLSGKSVLLWMNKQSTPYLLLTSLRDTIEKPQPCDTTDASISKPRLVTKEG